MNSKIKKIMHILLIGLIAFQVFTPYAMTTEVNASINTQDEAFNWSGVTLTIDNEETLHIPGSDKTLTNPAALYNAITINRAKKIEKIQFDGELSVAGNLSLMFMNFSNLKEIKNLNKLDTTDATSMLRMFEGDNSLVRLDLSAFKTEKVTNMSYMFDGDKSLMELNLQSFNTGNVTNMSGMLARINVKMLDISSFDTKKVTDMTGMFNEDRGLQELTLGKKFNFFDGDKARLPEIVENDDYSGKWESVGTGTTFNPNGKQIWTSKEFMNEYNGTADSGTYVWQPQVMIGNVTAKYVDENDNEIAKSETKSGNVGDDYTTEQKDIPGYTFKEVKGNASGTFTGEDQIVTYVYKKNKVYSGNVTAKYVDENDNEIAKSETKSGDVGDTYVTEQKEIPGYTFNEVKGNVSGTFTEEDQVITYVYKKNNDSSVNPGGNNQNHDEEDPVIRGEQNQSNKKKDNLANKTNVKKLPATGMETNIVSLLSVVGVMVLISAEYINVKLKND
ncbi:hypothetical protein RD055328_02380 [Companilactobacillus sp. RD055328]|uniref:MucBP domain-containing protein n=1 Tax=Companilactobacillus sp. RD055328 TaxID=2916634 RepID=UPI001FC895B8|nr:MucBP domain-containing protein [Companilactobacillus sp. RD055328]GKQ42315.1 hypothetical protein RD055328_02380 [Companilactobacillus sp. RD055328]